MVLASGRIDINALIQLQEDSKKKLGRLSF